MLSRWYSLFIRFLFVVLGIAGRVAGSRLHASGIITASIILLIIVIVALWIGFGVQSLNTVRWFAGVIGALFFIWGIIQMMAAPSANTMGVMTAVATGEGFLVLLGSLGLAAALVPATWLRDQMVPLAT